MPGLRSTFSRVARREKERKGEDNEKNGDISLHKVLNSENTFNTTKTEIILRQNSIQKSRL